MKLSDIKTLFEQQTSLNLFKEKIGQEVAEYKNRSCKRGGSNPIYLDEDVQLLQIINDDIKFLSKTFLEGSINEWELNYIAEGLLLSEKVSYENDKIEEALLNMADPEFFILDTKDLMKDILKDLERK